MYYKRSLQERAINFFFFLTLKGHTKTYESKTLLPEAHEKKYEKTISRKYYLRVTIGCLHPGQL